MRDKIASVLAFRTLPTTVVFLLIYAAIFISILSTDDLPNVPKASKRHGLELDEAYADLHQIAGLPHPYNSHQNDVVRTYILDRVKEIARTSTTVHVDDDLISNATFSHAVNSNNTGVATYFEGSNIVVKIDGSKPDLEGVMFSAHFDSVSTAPGATDDGMGTVSAIQLIEYFAKNRPKRTVVFNVNNGEEDGLNGAVAFLEHPWRNLTNSFLNLEGAGAGGRPLLLRATSTRMAKAFGKVSHPHGIVTTADAFKRRVIKSDTDYTIYTKAGFDGLDFTFYRQRSKYHTKEDSIPSLGGKAALWNMMESSLQMAKALANDEKSASRENSDPLYFDLFGEALVVTSLKTFYIVNIVLLAVGPFVVFGLAFIAHRKGKLYWVGRGWGRTPVALVISIAATLGVASFYSRVNKFIIYSSPAAVFVSLLSISYLAFCVAIELFSYFRPIPQQRSVVLLESYVFWWILLVIDTAVIGSAQLGGLYFVTFFHCATLAALLLGLLEHFELPGSLPRKDQRQAVRDVMDDENGENSSERTPLLGRNGLLLNKEDVDEDNQIGLWVVQFLLAVPFPVILAMQISMVLLHALRQGLADGTPALTAYLGVAVFAVLTFMPLLPFVHKLHRGIAYASVLVFAIALLYNVFSFPFSESSPFRVFFQQTIDLDSGVNNVVLTGVEPWVSRSIVPELPSSWGDEAKPHCHSVDPDFRAPLPFCSWHGLPPSVAPGNFSEWITVNATKDAPGMGTITIRPAANSRGCRLYFDADTPVTALSVRGGSGRVQPLFPLPGCGVTEARLWSRTWERTFDVSVVWADGKKPLKGRAACEWSESAGITAYEEVLAFLPRWTLVSKRSDGLLEGWKSFEIK